MSRAAKITDLVSSMIRGGRGAARGTPRALEELAFAGATKGQVARGNLSSGIRDLMRRHGDIKSTEIIRSGDDVAGLKLRFANGVEENLALVGKASNTLTGRAGRLSPGDFSGRARRLLGRRIKRAGPNRRARNQAFVEGIGDLNPQSLGGRGLSRALAATGTVGVGAFAGEQFVSSLRDQGAAQGDPLEQAIATLQMRRAQQDRIQRLQRTSAINTARLASLDPDLFNSLLAGRQLPRGAVAIGRPAGGTSILDDLSMMMASGAFQSAPTARFNQRADAEGQIKPQTLGF